MKHLNIGQRLSLSFLVVILLLLTGSMITFWQMGRMRAEARRVQQVDRKVAALLQVYHSLTSLTGGEGVSQTARDLVSQTNVDAREDQEAAFRAMGAAHQWAITATLLAALVTLLAASGLALAVRASITGPLRRLDAAAQAFGRGELQYHVEVRGDDELAHLGQAFNYAGAQMNRLYQELQAREAHFRALIENASDIITVHNLDGAITYSSPSIEKNLGYTSEELLNRSVFELIHPDDLPEVLEYFGKVIRTEEQMPPLTFRVSHKNGSWQFIEAAGRLVVNNPGLQGVVINSRNITERKRHESEREAIASLASALRTAQTRAEILSILLDQTIQLTGAEGAAFVVYHPASREAVVELGCGLWAETTGLHLAAGANLSSQAMISGKVYAIPDIHLDVRQLGLDLPADLPAAVCVPLAAQQQQLGALWAGSRTAFSPLETSLLAAMADIAANAIQRAALYEQTRQQLQRLIALRTIDTSILANLEFQVTMDVLLDQILEQLGLDAAAILLHTLHPPALTYTFLRGFYNTALQNKTLPLGQGLAGQVALQQKTRIIPDMQDGLPGSAEGDDFAAEGFVTAIAAPLLSKGQLKGVLVVYQRKRFVPHPEWTDFLDMLVGQAAIAIENASLLSDLQRSNQELKTAYDGTIEGWSRALDLRDRETEGHSERVTEITLRLAELLGVSQPEERYIRWGALLHDIGKMGIPDSILLKPGPLSEGEWAIMRRHPVYALEMLQPIPYLRPALDIPYCHHERWDGSGYPRGLKREEIPLLARIFAVADVWDALTSDRPYRSAWPQDAARAYLEEQAGKYFDPRIVEVFLKTL